MNSVFEKVQFYVSVKYLIKKNCKSAAMVPSGSLFLRSGLMSPGRFMGGGTPTRCQMPSAPSAQAQPLGGIPTLTPECGESRIRTSSILPVS